MSKEGVLTLEQRAEIGNLFYSKRKSKGVTQEEIERRTGVSSAVISRFEHGKQPVSPQFALEMLLSVADTPDDGETVESIANAIPPLHGELVLQELIEVHGVEGLRDSVGWVSHVLNTSARTAKYRLLKREATGIE